MPTRISKPPARLKTEPLEAPQACAIAKTAWRRGIRPGTGLNNGTWISTAYLIGEFIMIPLTDYLTRVFGFRRFILSFTVLFLIFSVGCAFASTPNQMILTRGFQGFFGGCLIPLAFTTVLTRLPDRRASDVVARLRSLARRDEAVRAAVEVNGVIEETLHLVARELSNHRVALDLVLQRDLPTVLGDRVQLQQVAINLVLNAVQAMDSVAEERRRLSIATRVMDGTVSIEGTDNGPGVDPANVPLMFNAFYSTKTDGMGMGLSISRSIVEAHDGRIVAVLGEGGGMHFTVTLPVPKEAQP